MKTIRIITQLAILASMVLTSCQDYEAGFTAADIFKGTYARKFVEKFGAIDPEETWDLSTAGGRRSGGIATRAAGTYESVASTDGYYYLPDKQLNWMKEKLPESTDNSSIMKSFEMTWEEGNVFEVIPIYEGKASLRWRLGIQVMSADGKNELYNTTFWTKPTSSGSEKKFQVIWNAEPTLASNDEISVFYETTDEKPRIWAWGPGVQGFPEGGWNNRPYMTRIGCNGDGNYVYKYTFSGSNIPTGVKFIDGDNCDLGFVNHGYYKANGGAGRYDHEVEAIYNVETTYKNKTDDWVDFKNENDGAYAAQFRSKPELSTTFLGNSDFPTGSKVLFYLEIIENVENISGTPVGTKQFSNNKQMTLLPCDRPSNIPDGYKTYILGVEDLTLTSSDKDYNDIVFLIAGKVPDPVYYKKDPEVVVTEKRYMCEDLTNTGDFDFNDIVIDVRQTVTKYYRETTDPNDIVVAHETTEQEAKVSWLCGTVPITAKVGDHMFPLITDPSKQNQSKDQLNISNYDYSNCTWGDGKASTSGYCPMENFVPITGWNPLTNNITIYVCWDGKKATTLDNPTSISGDVTSIDGSSVFWISTFPERGKVPYIIATDLTDKWTEECENIEETSWWRDHFLWSSPTNK